MLKKILAAVTLACLVPALANAAWFFNTQARSGGGTITSRNMTNQRVTDGSIFRSYTTHASLDVTVTADRGFSIRNVTVNKTSVGSAKLGTGATSYSTKVQGMTDQSVTATFVPASLSVTASNPGGTVSPHGVGNIWYGYTLSSPLVFQFTPATGYQITGVQNIPDDPKVTHSAFSPGVNIPVTVRFERGFVFTGAIDLRATVENKTPSVAASLPKTVVAGESVSISASASNVPDNATYTWTYVSGPANLPVSSGNPASPTSFIPGPAIAAFPATNPTVTFTAPSTLGQYKFKVVVSSAGRPDLVSLAVVNVFASGKSSARNQCQFCHDANGIGGKQLFGNWSASGHKANGVTCAKCHTGANTGGHPGPVTRSSVSGTTFDYNSPSGSGNFCTTCHSPSIVTDFAASPHAAPAAERSCSFCHSNGVHNPTAACIDCHFPGNTLGLAWPPAGLDFHNTYNGTNLCSTCHKLHNPGVVTGMSGPTHYSNISSGSYPASYVTSRAACPDCHASTAENAVVRHQWDRSGHGATTAPAFSAYDFKTMSGCVQCHSTTGFIAYSTGKSSAAWGTASDKTKEVIACNGCHSDTANGVVRKVSPVTPFAGDDYRNRDLGTSNICLDCHSGTNNGLSIVSSDFTQQPFIAPHYLAAGGVLHGKGGYHFPGQSYDFYSSNTHRTIGMANSEHTGTDGPCVGCHMSAPKKHLFQPVSSAGNGAIVKVTSPVCANCHGTTLEDAALLNARRASFGNALEVLKQTLAYRGFRYTQEYPHFANTNWAATQEGARSMGAAFNYVLLLNEPGAYAHNEAYAKQLVFDSIDYLYNGSITGSINSAADALVGNGITTDQAESLKAYQAANSCSICHSNTSGSHPAHLAAELTCAACHSATALNKSSLVPGSSKHINGVVDLAPGPGVSFGYAAGTCSSISCHGGSNAVWGSTLSCSSCHGYPPPNGAASYTGTDETTSPHLKHAGQGSNYSYACNQCHQGNSHGTATFQDVFIDRSGILAGSAAAYDKSTRSCSALYCHSNGTALATGQTPIAGVAWGPGKLTCDGCHGYPPAYTNQSPKANSHAKHNFSCNVCHFATSVDGSSIADHTRHVNGSYDVTPGPTATFSYSFAGTGGTCSNISCHGGSNAVWGSTLSCSGCHGYPPPSGAASYTGTDETTSPHLKHAGQGSNYSYACNQCHQGNSHGTGTFQDVFIDRSGILAGGTAAYDKSTRTCSALYCHSNGTALATGQTPIAGVAWGPGKLACDGCHGYPPAYTNQSPKANSHAKHNFSCNVCHFATSVDGSSIANHTRHVNGSYDVTPGPPVTFSYSFAGTGGTCSNISCHGGSSAVWGSTLSCSGCHGYPPPNGAASYTGTDETTSPHLKHASPASYGFNCDECHKGNSHATGTFQDVFIDKSGIKAGSAASYDRNTRTCTNISCHDNGTSVATGQPAGVSAVWGSNKLACDGCHANPPAYANGAPKANNHGTHLYDCGTCHAGTTVDGVTIANKSLHLNRSYDLVPGPGTTFTYTYSNTGGNCSNVSCHQGIDAKWGTTLNGRTVDHLAAPRSGNINVFLESTWHDDGEETVTENCYLCHYRNIATQHANNCSICHAGANPAGALIAAGGWNKSCDACHPTFHPNIDHDSYADLNNCTNCHSTADPWGSYGTKTGDNCAWCHSPAQTAQIFSQRH